MKDKIISDFESTESYSRFYATVYHSELISQRPFFGWGTFITDFELSPNGLTQIIVHWGILFGIFYFVNIFKGIKKQITVNSMPSHATIILFIALLGVTFSQSATIEPFYFLIMFFGLTDIRNEYFFK
jgi:hypothetical protein